MRTAAVGALMLVMAASGRSVHAQLMPAEWIGVRAPSGGPSGLFDRSQPERSTAGVDPYLSLDCPFSDVRSAPPYRSFSRSDANPDS